MGKSSSYTPVGLEVVGFVAGFVIFTVVLVEVGTVETVTAATLGLPAFCGVTKIRNTILRFNTELKSANSLHSDYLRSNLFHRMMSPCIMLSEHQFL